jgi:hypothetical protein
MRISITPDPIAFIGFQSEGMSPIWAKLSSKPAAFRRKVPEIFLTGANEFNGLHAVNI